MEIKTNEKRDAVLIRFNEEGMYDSIYMNEGFDHNGEHYIIFEDLKDVEKFIEYAKKTLGIDEDVKDYYFEEEMETNFVFSDEYTQCHDCGAVVRTQPNSYSWTPEFAIINECELLCKECIMENAKETYIEELINNYNNANQLLSDSNLEELGFKQINGGYQDGWYDRHDNPEKIYNNLKDKYEEVLFSIDDTGQFHTNFSVWVRGEELEEDNGEDE